MQPKQRQKELKTGLQVDVFMIGVMIEGWRSKLKASRKRQIHCRDFHLVLNSNSVWSGRDTQFVLRAVFCITPAMVLVTT